MTLVYFSSFFSSLGDQIWQGHILWRSKRVCLWRKNPPKIAATTQALFFPQLWWGCGSKYPMNKWNPNLKPTWFKEELENVTAEPILATLQMQSTDVFAITAQSWSILKFSDCHLDVIECYWLISCKTISEKCQFVCFRQNLTTDVLWCIETVSSCF